jgi:ribosome-binding protein aMBF1 (putative translation factor)
VTEDEFTERFRAAVRASGLSLRRLSQELDASPTSMSRWYGGHNAPPKPFRKLLVRAVQELPPRKRGEQLELSDAAGRDTPKA